jgi:hypothetical protein
VISPDKIVRRLLGEDDSIDLSARSANIISGLVGEYLGERPTKEGGWPEALKKLANMDAASVLYTRKVGTKTYLEIRDWLAARHGIRWPSPQEILELPSRRADAGHHRRGTKPTTLHDLRKLVQNDSPF